MREALSMSARRMQTVRRGGNEILRILYREPQGESAAMQHMRALIAALRDHAATQLREELAAADRPLRGRYEISLREQRGKHFDRLILTAALRIEGKTVRENTLITCWDKEGTYQRRVGSKGPLGWWRSRGHA